MIIQLQECLFVEIFCGNAGDKDSGSLYRCRVPRSNEMMLTYCDEIGHLVFDIVPNPNFGQVRSVPFVTTKELTREKVYQDEMSRIAISLVSRNIAENEFVETRMRGHYCVDARNGHEDDPRDEPYWKEYFTHDAKEADEEVCIHAIDDLDVPIVRLIDC
jgi:hypothetical protein